MIGMLLLSGAVLAHQASQARRAQRISASGGAEMVFEGWTVIYPSPDGQGYPTTLVIAQWEQVTHRIQGNPLVGKWMFWENGNQVAYQTGSLHFNMGGVLVDIASGRQLANLDCYRELAEDAPTWEKALRDALVNWRSKSAMHIAAGAYRTPVVDYRGQSTRRMPVEHLAVAPRNVTHTDTWIFVHRLAVQPLLPAESVQDCGVSIARSRVGNRCPVGLAQR
ncbi:hypothetical protein ACTMU2_20945 [Cupriavidus basilensis]